MPFSHEDFSADSPPLPRRRRPQRRILDLIAEEEKNRSRLPSRNRSTSAPDLFDLFQKFNPDPEPTMSMAMALKSQLSFVRSDLHPIMEEDEGEDSHRSLFKEGDLKVRPSSPSSMSRGSRRSLELIETKRRSFSEELADCSVAPSSPAAWLMYDEIDKELKRTHEDLLDTLYQPLSKMKVGEGEVRDTWGDLWEKERLAQSMPVPARNRGGKSVYRAAELERESGGQKGKEKEKKDPESVAEKRMLHVDLSGESLSSLLGLNDSSKAWKSERQEVRETWDPMIDDLRTFLAASDMSEGRIDTGPELEQCDTPRPPSASSEWIMKGTEQDDQEEMAPHLRGGAGGEEDSGRRGFIGTISPDPRFSICSSDLSSIASWNRPEGEDDEMDEDAHLRVSQVNFPLPPNTARWQAPRTPSPSSTKAIHSPPHPLTPSPGGRHTRSPDDSGANISSSDDIQGSGFHALGFPGRDDGHRPPPLGSPFKTPTRDAGPRYPGSTLDDLWENDNDRQASVLGRNDTSQMSSSSHGLRGWGTRRVGADPGGSRGGPGWADAEALRLLTGNAEPNANQDSFESELPSSETLKLLGSRPLRQNRSPLAGRSNGPAGQRSNEGLPQQLQAEPPQSGQFLVGRYVEDPASVSQMRSPDSISQAPSGWFWPPRAQSDLVNPDDSISTVAVRHKKKKRERREATLGVINEREEKIGEFQEWIKNTHLRNMNKKWGETNQAIKKVTDDPNKTEEEKTKEITHLQGLYQLTWKKSAEDTGYDHLDDEEKFKGLIFDDLPADFLAGRAPPRYEAAQVASAVGTVRQPPTNSPSKLVAVSKKVGRLLRWALAVTDDPELKSYSRREPPSPQTMPLLGASGGLFVPQGRLSAANRLQATPRPSSAFGSRRRRGKRKQPGEDSQRLHSAPMESSSGRGPRDDASQTSVFSGTTLQHGSETGSQKWKYRAGRDTQVSTSTRWPTQSEIYGGRS